MRRILICGARSWTNPRPIEIVMLRLLEETRKEDLLVIEGGCTGVDLVAEKVCKQIGVHTARIGALWDAYGRSAGPRRNAVMQTLEPELVIAFHFSRERLSEDGSGTGNCIRMAHKNRIPVQIKLVDQAVADAGVAAHRRLVEERGAKKRPRKRA